LSHAHRLPLVPLFSIYRTLQEARARGKGWQHYIVSRVCFALQIVFEFSVSYAPLPISSWPAFPPLRFSRPWQLSRTAARGNTITLWLVSRDIKTWPNALCETSPLYYMYIRSPRIHMDHDARDARSTKSKQTAQNDTVLHHSYNIPASIVCKRSIS
jgi:hypothetical protein